MEFFICKKCQKEFKTIQGLSKHNLSQHNIKPKEIYI